MSRFAPLDLARGALLAAALLTWALGPGTSMWNRIALLAVCTSVSIGWAQREFGPASKAPDKVVPRALLLIGLACMAALWFSA